MRLIFDIISSRDLSCDTSCDQIQVLSEPQLHVKGYFWFRTGFWSNLKVKGEVFLKGGTAKGTPQHMLKHDSHITNLK